MLLRLRDIGFAGYVNVRDPAAGLALEDEGFYASDGEKEFPVNVSRAGRYTIYIRGNLADPYSGSVRMAIGPP